ncbi:hypothetical protein CEXT_553831 [Caerostris extrusa]|uniref:Uncharacterized protein n=1 Tax=Caerostris extrusa TaxID=172846 RepID=A0AAV4SA93_CAEEX|nr:hypothetical protein CEXT_553831 [Caerostris extrusa]
MIQAPGTESGREKYKNPSSWKYDSGHRNRKRKEKKTRILPPGSEFPGSKAKGRGNWVIYVLSAPSLLSLLRCSYIYIDHLFRKGSLVSSGETMAEVLLFFGGCREEGKVISGRSIGTENGRRKEKESFLLGSEFPGSKAKGRGNWVIYVLSAPSLLSLLRCSYIYVDHLFRKRNLVSSGETMAEVLLFLGGCREGEKCPEFAVSPAMPIYLYRSSLSEGELGVFRKTVAEVLLFLGGCREEGQRNFPSPPSWVHFEQSIRYLYDPGARKQKTEVEKNKNPFLNSGSKAIGKRKTGLFMMPIAVSPAMPIYYLYRSPFKEGELDIFRRNSGRSFVPPNKRCKMFTNVKRKKGSENFILLVKNINLPRITFPSSLHPPKNNKTSAPVSPEDAKLPCERDDL